MKKLISSLLLATTLCFAATAAADSIADVHTCELKDDMEIEDVQAQNSKWLKWVNEHVEGGGITSAVGTAVVGDQDIFLFVDTYPSLSSWAATQEALDSDAADELEELFEDTNDCSENRLWKIEETK